MRLTFCWQLTGLHSSFARLKLYEFDWWVLLVVVTSQDRVEYSCSQRKSSCKLSQYVHEQDRSLNKGLADDSAEDLQAVNNTCQQRRHSINQPSTHSSLQPQLNLFTYRLEVLKIFRFSQGSPNVELFIKISDLDGQFLTSLKPFHRK